MKAIMKNFILFLLIFLACMSSQAFTITSFSTSAYSADLPTLNANLGLTGNYIFENFEDSTIVAGFTVTYDDNGAGGGFDLRASSSWEGSKALAIYSDYAPYRNTNYNKQPTFTFTQALSSFGIGFGGLDQAGWEIYVNGIQVVSDIKANPNWTSGSRNVYYRIDAGTGEQINTVKVFTASTSVASTVSDYVTLDYLAFKVQTTSVPEPATAMLFGLAILSTVGIRFLTKSLR